MEAPNTVARMLIGMFFCSFGAAAIIQIKKGNIVPSLELTKHRNHPLLIDYLNISTELSVNIIYSCQHRCPFE